MIEIFHHLIILEILSGLQVGGIGIIAWLVWRRKSVGVSQPGHVLLTNAPTTDHGVWDVMEGETKVGAVRVDSPAWFQHAAEGRSFRNPQTGETR
jgi:hypothetical protein